MPNAAASRLVLAPYSEALVTQTARELLKEVGGHVTCAFVFASAHYREVLPDFLELLQLHGHVPLLAGSSGSGLIGTAKEAEGAEGFSLLFLHLPGTDVQAVEFQSGTIPEFRPPDTAAGRGEQCPEVCLLLANPLAVDIESTLQEWSTTHPGIPCLGGLGSGGRNGADIFTLRNREVVESGLAIRLMGGVRVRTVVSQGCRPVGEPFTITGAEENVVTSLASRPAYERLNETFEALPDADKAVANGNLFAGLAMSEYVDDFKTGDFLVRNLVGADPHTGALAIGAHPRIGQTLQFQLRDRASANNELHRLLATQASEGTRPFASLIFSCTGRGQNLFGTPHHDAAALCEHFGPIPSAGFFCNGEIGPVAGRNFVHGYTASIALLTDA